MSEFNSCWKNNIATNKYNELKENINTEIAIVGGGIAGLSCAYTLAKKGKSVIIIDDGLIGGGETGHTSAHLASYLDDRFINIKKLFGLKKARLAYESHRSAIDYIEKIIGEENIDCDFKRVNGYLFAGHNGLDFLKREAQILTEMKNIPFSWEKKAPFKNFDSKECLKFPSQAQFHPLKYLQGLAKAIIKYNGQIFTFTHGQKIIDGQPCKIITAKGYEISAKNIIIATNSPINNRLFIQTKQAQYRTYIIAILVTKEQLEEALYWDTDDPYHYVRVISSYRGDKDLIIIGGEDHKTGQNTPSQAFSALKKWIEKIFPSYEIAYQWSGQVIEPVDALAFIGKNPGDEHIYIATGDSGQGLTHGTIAGLLIPDLIMTGKSLFKSLYNPRRKNIKSLPHFLKECGNMIAQYGDWFKTLPSGDIKNMSINEGKIVRDGLKIKAIYKDTDNQIHCLSAVCPHLGGLVRWNKAEKSWDCPCHGSRFTGQGEVINGPANRNLTKIK